MSTSECQGGIRCRHESLTFPVFDVDNHMYETTDAFTKFLPAGVRGTDQVRRRDGAGRRSPIRNVISDYIPNPTFEVVAAPGAQEQYFKEGNPEGKSRRRSWARPIRCHSRPIATRSLG